MKPMEWISASDRLPKHEEMVLAIVTGRFGVIGLENTYELAVYSPIEGWTLDTWPEEEEPAFTVSHWMELPEAPGTPKTNADRIRGMSDEELAGFLANPVISDFCFNLPDCVEALDANIDIPEDRCRECALRWLQSPVEDGEK